MFTSQGDMVSRYTAQQGGFPASEYVQCTYSYKYASKSSSQVVYSKGTLVQAGIVAEDGTYPVNGRHSDGYFYVRGAVVNTAPTMPGAFTQPSGNLEIGDSKVFVVGVASDAEGNLSKYIWEASINGGAFSKVGETTANSLAYTIPTATNLKMRVKAVDLAGLESEYRESSLYTVTKPTYYYSKYNVANQQVVNWTYRGESSAVNGWPSYEIRGSTLYSTGVYEYHNWGSLPVGRVIYGNATSALSISRYRFVASNKVEEDIGTLGTVQVAGSLIQSGINAIDGTYPTNGKHTDGFWYIRGSRVNQSITPPTPFTLPAPSKKFKPNEAATITFGASNATNLSLYEVDYRYNTTGTWTPLPYNNTLTRSLTITTDKTLKTLELRVRAKNTSNVYSDYVYSEPFEIEHNVAPIVSLTGPGDNSTLYENDTLTIGGTAYDADPDQAVTVYYQINAEPRKVLTTNLSKVQIALSKQLTFKAGKIYDGETVLTDTLAAGLEHKLKVWAVDSENATSVVVERTFFVVPNRAPLLSLDAVVPSGVVDVDKFKISGTASDEDANSSVKVTRKINSGDPVEIYSGQGGTWEFDLSLSQLIVGENTIVIEVIDNYGAKVSKTIKLEKNEVKTPILHAVARYKITPPAGSAKGVLLFIERDEDMDLKVELSMTLAGEQEQYETLTADNTAPMPNTNSIVEDTYYFETTEPKDNIILKISTTRPDATVNHKIHLISGAVE
ncbi:hypothetical protein RKS58_07065 [Lysinibacillus capsici]|uniref:hypothetical protein n=1 Tax=Lysinibacillus capsici TaxID=2115968 RepID=UPI0028BF45FC|nr:hypothetical protein [Lysinibacillus capsici]WNN77597.1 hypothetical protein RKS58_07065 [Lysinibacillus capsici]